MDVATGKRWFLILLGAAVLVAALRLWEGVGSPRYQGFSGREMVYVLDTHTGCVWHLTLRLEGGRVLFQEAILQPAPWEARR
ncbi:MAG TPA: hypothetical protein VLG48_11050 [Candidatus Methylomirabilis sp.]|nr:hypothetical protein [Candidatus Methylomirabilis sp.]